MSSRDDDFAAARATCTRRTRAKIMRKHIIRDRWLKGACREYNELMQQPYLLTTAGITCLTSGTSSVATGYEPGYEQIVVIFPTQKKDDAMPTPSTRYVARTG